MKKLLVIFAVILLMAGCAQPVVETKSTPEDTLKPTTQATEGPTPSPSIEPMSDATIWINEKSWMTIIISLTDGVVTGTAGCFFDGTDTTKELEYILATTLIFGELGISNYSFIGMSGEDLISVIVEDGEKSEYSILPIKYGELETDYDRGMEYVQAIAAALGNDGESAELGGNATSQTESQAARFAEKILIDNDDVVITFVGLKKESKNSWKNAFEISLKIENKSSRDLTVQIRQLSVNDIMSDGSISSHVSAGKTAYDGIEVEWKDTVISSIDEIKNIEWKFHIFDLDDWSNSFDSEVVSIAPLG